MKRTMLKIALAAALFLVAGALSFAGGDAEATRSKSPVKLSLWNSSQTMVDWYNETVIPQFKKTYPEVESVDILYMPIQDFVKKLAVALPSGDVPDVIEIEDSWATPYVTAGYFDPNTDELNNLVNKMQPAFKGCLTYEGKMWGVPVAPFHEIMFYNKDMMAAAGIKKIPETYAELIDAAVKMTKRDSSGKVEVSGFSMRLGGNPSGTTQKWWVLALLANGVDLWEESKTQPGKYHCGFNNEGGYNALKLYIDLLYKYKVDDFSSMKDTAAFAAGKTAINMREPSSAVSIIKNGPNVNWVAAPMPAGPKNHATFLITLNLYIPKDGKNKVYAQEFVKLASSYEMQASQVRLRAGMSPFVGFDHLAPEAGLDPRLAPSYAFPKGMKLVSVPVQNAYDTIQVKLGEMLPNIFAKAELLDNPQGIKKEVEAMAKVVNDIYKDFDEYGD